MTGRDLIIYILENNLEDEPISVNSNFLGFMTIDEAAVKYDVGPATVKLWFELNVIPGIKMGEVIYILPNVTKGVV